MTTPSAVLEEAARWIGYRETPDGSNHVDPITPWWPMQDAWCACFVSFVFWNVGLPIGPRYNGHSSGYIWCSDGADWFRQQGRIVPSSQAQPGSPLFFEWGSTPGGYDHTGICVENLGWGLTTIEGNVGNRVDVHTRSYDEIPEAALPAWAELPPPAPIKRSKKMIDSLTMPADHPATPNIGVEVTAIGSVVLMRWEQQPGDQRPENWTLWQQIGGVPFTPGPVDSISVRLNASRCLEVLAWSSADVNHKFRAWQVSPGGAWDGWLDVP